MKLGLKINQLLFIIIFGIVQLMFIFLKKIYKTQSLKLERDICRVSFWLYAYLLYLESY